MWNDLILAHEGPSDTRDTKIAALRLKFKAFTSLEDSDSDVEEDQRTNIRNSWPDLLLSIMKELYLQIRRGFIRGLAGLDYKGKYKGLKAKMVVLTKRIDDMTKGKSEKGKKDKEKSEKGLLAESFDWDDKFVSSDDEGSTKIRAFMAIAEDEPSVGKADARSGQWVDITMKKVHKLLSMIDGDERKHVLDYTHVDLHYVEDQRKNLICSKVTLDQLLSEQVPGNIIKALGGKGRRKEKISSKEVIFTKDDESSSMLAPEISSDSESECDSQEPLPPLPKLIGATPSGTSEKKSSAGPKTCSDKKANTSTEQLILTLMEENANTVDSMTITLTTMSSTLDVKYVVVLHMKHLTALRNTPTLGDQGLPTGNQNPLKSPKVVFGDDSSGDTEGYGSVNCNGITFTRVAYVNGLKHNLISISQLCDANYKVLFTKTQGTIYNQNDEVVLIAPRRRDVYVIDMSSYNKESNASCEKGKHHIASFKTKRSFFINESLHLLHMDLFGPVKPQTIIHNKYTLVIIDEYSRKMENLNEVRVKKLRSDNGTEFRNHKLESFCDEKDDQPTPSEDDHPGLADGIDPAEAQDDTISEIQTSPTPITPSEETNSQPLVPQDIWIRDSEAASAHECLYVNFLSEMEPKKLIEAL
ncbi:retrovirus-related pol polyprotein from transposon TNT 1-94 [Tanacetum coccineum]